MHNWILQNLESVLNNRRIKTLIIRQRVYFEENQYWLNNFVNGAGNFYDKRRIGTYCISSSEIIIINL